MVKNRLAQPDAQEHGWLLDGYPRSPEQAEAIEEAGIRPDVFILIDVRARCSCMPAASRGMCEEDDANVVGVVWKRCHYACGAHEGRREKP